MNIVDAVIAGKLSGGPSGPITPGSIVNATGSMTPIQQAQTAQNLGVANDISSLGQEMYNKEIISSTADALFPLTASSGIYANTGVNTTSNKYCRSGFHYAASRMLILGLEEYEWCSWCYSSNQWGTQTHSNTNGEYISGLNAIYVAPQSGDNRYVVSFRRVDGATLTTDTSDPTSDFYKIQHAFRVFECQIDNVITNVAYQNEYTYNYGLDIAKKYGTFETATKNGVTFSWDGERCHVSGTSTSQATYTIYDSRTSLPPELNPGDWLMMDYQPSVETVKLRYYIAFWKSGDTSDPVFSKLDMIPRGFVVPDNAVGITLQIRVPSSTTIDRYVNKIRLVKVRPQYTEPRLLVSFVDDDTSGLTYVQRYHDACRHNGIFGNYAVLTTYPEQSQTMKETLLGYEDEGFGTLIHAYRQSSDDPWQTMGSDESKIEQCRAVLAKGLRQMRDMGFANYNYWVSPYGIKGPQAVRIAKDLGVECLISTNNFRHNDMMAYNPYYIKRVALHQDDNGNPDLKNTLADVKAAIDAAAASTSGAWLIITTHFNEWGDLTWDDTTDENGYPVGYARFNEMVQYAINAGLTPVTVPEGWTLYKPILTANKNLIDHAGATTSGQINGAIIGGGNKNVTANEIVAATNRMTPAQAAQTVQNLGIPMAVYPGVDLTVKFADEIENYTDEWAWIHARIQAGDYGGININDYIPVVANSNNFKARVMGINTYKGYGDTEVGKHIDWIFEELWPTLKPINPANYNNGLIPKEDVVANGTDTSFVLTKEMNSVAKIEMGGSELSGWSYDPATYIITFTEAPAAGTMTVTGTGTEYPWLASDAYHFANSLAGQVPNSTGLNPAVKHVDYTQDGVYYYLPQNLKNVIIQKRMYLPKRYSATGVLSNPNAGGWTDIGYIWFPTECEVYGQGVWANTAYDMAGSALQYPLFAGNMNRAKKRSGSRNAWWLVSAYSGYSSYWCVVSSNGSANHTDASSTYVAAPVCFRTA